MNYTMNYVRKLIGKAVDMDLTCTSIDSSLITCKVINQLEKENFLVYEYGNHTFISWGVTDFVPYKDERGFIIFGESTWLDDVGGFHDEPEGWNPNNVSCGECNSITCKGCTFEHMKPKDCADCGNANCLECEVNKDLFHFD